MADKYPTQKEKDTPHTNYTAKDAKVLKDH